MKLNLEGFVQVYRLFARWRRASAHVRRCHSQAGCLGHNGASAKLPSYYIAWLCHSLAGCMQGLCSLWLLRSSNLSSITSRKISCRFSYIDSCASCMIQCHHLRMFMQPYWQYFFAWHVSALLLVVVHKKERYIDCHFTIFARSENIHVCKPQRALSGKICKCFLRVSLACFLIQLRQCFPLAYASFPCEANITPNAWCPTCNLHPSAQQVLDYVANTRF